MGSVTDPNVVLYVRIRKTTHERIRDEAARRGMSMSKFVDAVMAGSFAMLAEPGPIFRADSD